MAFSLKNNIDNERQTLFKQEKYTTPSFQKCKIWSEIKLAKGMNQDCSSIPLKHVIYRKHINFRSCLWSRWKKMRDGQAKMGHRLRILHHSKINRREPCSGDSPNNLDSESANQSQNIKTEGRTALTMSEHRYCTLRRENICS